VDKNKVMERNTLLVYSFLVLVIMNVFTHGIYRIK